MDWDHRWWGLERRDGRLVLEGQDLTELAERHGTPLHVVSGAALRRRCRELLAAFAQHPAPVRVCYSYKTNPVSPVLRVLHEEGLGAEVVSGFELWLARRLGVPGRDVVVNGPNKSDAELRAAVREEVHLLVVDGLDELVRVERIAEEEKRRAPVAIRLRPGLVPRGMNPSTATGGPASQFGLELDGPELEGAIARAARSPSLVLRGFHAHVGSGIHDLDVFRETAERLVAVLARARRAGAEPDVIDLGGGLGSTLSRELTRLEMLGYLAFGWLPKPGRPAPADLVQQYGRLVSEAVASAAARQKVPVPGLVLEPGRAVTSEAQVLLLRVGAVRERRGCGRVAFTDGGAMSTSLTLLSEVHAVLLASREGEGRARTSLFGRVPSPLDVLYRNVELPALREGDLLAVMDAGAYFTSTASNFAGPRPAVLLLEGGRVSVARRRETFEDLVRLEEEAP